MFTPDVINLKNFYDTPFGRDVQKFLGDQIRQLWAESKNDCVLGIGYCQPYMESLFANTEDLCVGMPANQGAIYWPAEAGNKTFIMRESELPFRDQCFNRVLLIHSFENTDYIEPMIEEAWRVLHPEGRLILAVPNRIGLWSHFSHTPFGFGRPYNLAQIRTLLNEKQFSVTYNSSALFMPPTRFKLLWKMAKYIEIVGRVVLPFFGGVLLVEAKKQIYASVKQPLGKDRKRYDRAIRKPAMSFD